MIDRATIDRIMDATDIVDVISEFVTLRKRGTSYTGLCPFHDDKTPSFSVSPSKGVYKCFACGEAGNAVNFIMKHEQKTYPEALRWLANRYHIEIHDRELTDEELEKRRILGTEGFVSSFVVVDTDAREVVSGPKIYLNAVAEDESEFDKVRHQIVEQLQDAMMQGTRDTYKLQQIMRRTLGGWVARQLHRKPMIVPVVADIATDVDDAMLIGRD